MLTRASTMPCKLDFRTVIYANLFVDHLLALLKPALGSECLIRIGQNLAVYRSYGAHEAGIVQVGRDDNIGCFTRPAKSSFPYRFLNDRQQKLVRLCDIASQDHLLRVERIDQVCQSHPQVVSCFLERADGHPVSFLSRLHNERHRNSLEAIAYDFG